MGFSKGITMFSQTLCCVTTIVAIIGIADIFHRQLEEKEAMRKQMAELQKEKEEAEKLLSDTSMTVLDLRAQLRAKSAA